MHAKMCATGSVGFMFNCMVEINYPQQLMTAFEDLGEAESVSPTWKPQNTVPVDEDKAGTLMKLIDTLEDDDDVQKVFSNFEIDDAVMEKLGEG